MSAMLKACPAIDKKKDVQAVLRLTSAMAHGNVYTLAEKPAQAKHGALKTVLCSLVDGKVPDVSIITQDPEATKLTESLSHSCRYTPSAGGSSGKELTGLCAPQALKGELEQRVSKEASFRRTTWS